jgi:hypothetical protein
MKNLALVLITFVSTVAFAGQLKICRNSEGSIALLTSQKDDGSIDRISLEKPMQLVKPSGVPRHNELDEYVTILEGVAFADKAASQIEGQSCDKAAKLSLDPISANQFILKLECDSSNGYSNGVYTQSYYDALTCE